MGGGVRGEGWGVYERPKSDREERGWQVLIGLQPALKNVMRLLSCYSTADCGNKERVTREALSWKYRKNQNSHTKRNILSSCLCSFTLSPVLPHIRAAEEDQCVTDRMRWRRGSMSALQWAERTKNQEWLAGDGSLVEPLKGGTPRSGGASWEFAWFLLGLHVAYRLWQMWKTFVPDVFHSSKMLC